MVRQKQYLHFLCCSVVIDKKSWFQLLLFLLLFKEGQVKWPVFPTLISFVVTSMARCVLSPFVGLHGAFSRVKTDLYKRRCQVQSSSKVLGEQVLEPLQEPVPTGWVHLHPFSIDIHFHWSLLRHLQLLYELDP